MIFNQNNVGKNVTINGNVEEISYVVADGLSFRIKSEENGPVVHDYNENYIEAAQSLCVSFNNGKTWVNVPFTQNV